VRSYLAHFLVDAADTKGFAPYIDDTYLRHLFAETKIVNALGEPEQWASQLPPELFKQLKDRVDLDFAFTNKTRFQVDDAVRLDLHVKNVSTLIVKVYEINAESYYRQALEEIDTDVNLDGLVANHEQTFTYAEPPLRRIKRSFDFPHLDKPGIYVVDFIGNGRSSRALVRKGRLRYLASTSSSGQRLTIMDEQHRKVDDARAWLAGHEYAAGKDGTILIPFSTDPDDRPIVLSRGPLSSLDTFSHEGEDYTLRAGLHVDRESLLARKKAQVVIRPGLAVNGIPISVKLLEKVRLTIVSRDHDGIPTSQEVPIDKLFEDRETTHEFLVPARVASIQFSLHAQVKSLSQGKPVDLVASETFALNEIERTEKIEDLHLARFGQRYVLELLGRTGESKAHRAVQVSLKHRDFQQPVSAALKSDERGSIDLGSLDGIDSLTATTPEGTSHTWPLRRDQHTYPHTLHGRAGETLSVPYLGSAAEPLRDELSLLELREDSYLADRFNTLAIKDGMLQLRNLPAGDYELRIKHLNVTIRVRVVNGPLVGRCIVGATRQVETAELPPLQIASIDAGAEQLTIKLTNQTPLARVHVFASRYVPAYDPFVNLSRVRGAEPFAVLPASIDSVYITGREIGDEYRYILDRKYAQKFPGNTLDRPSLLLNPWAVRSTQTGDLIAADGGLMGGMGGGQGSGAMDRLEREAAGETGQSDFANLDFLHQGTIVLLNQVADKAGLVTIPRAALGNHQHLQVVAADPVNVTLRTVTLAEPKAIFVDLRQSKGLTADAHFTQQKRISVVGAGQSLVIEDVTTSRWETYDSLARVHQLYTTLSGDPRLAEFSFLLAWPKLKLEDKREKYSKYACHELSFFLAKKDPEFFQQVVKPYLANKKDKKFLDHWLLGSDLAEFTQPWQHAQLNIPERILLAQRLAAERPRQARHISDLFQMLPPNVDEFHRLFDTAIKGRALDSEQVDEAEIANASKEEVQLWERQVDKSGGATGGPGKEGKEGLGRLPELRRNIDAIKQLKEVEELQKDVISDQRSMEESKSMADLQARNGRTQYRFDRAKNKANDHQNGAIVAGIDLELREELRVAQRQFFRQLDPTMEWAENNYYQLPIDQQHGGLITVNGFWRDYAQHDPTQPFLSRQFATASRNFSEIMFALAVLDLPFESPENQAKFEDKKLTLTARSSLIALHEEIKPAKPAAGASPILVTQNFFRNGDRTRLENGEQVDKYVTEEFLTQTVYGCQVVVTNPTSSRQKLALLVQIPAGAIPVLNSHPTKSIPVTLEPYHTQTVEFHFYFPAAGQFPHFPVHVARNDDLIAAAQPFVFNVVEQPSKIDEQAWDYVSQQGTSEQVLAMLRARNIQQLNLDKIAFRMKDRAFFDAVLALLAERRVFHSTLWSYGILHDAPAAVRQFLLHSDLLVKECGGRLASPLLDIDLVSRRTFEHLEYKPLVNARAHPLGKRRQIVNDRLHAQYHAYLKELGYQPTLSDTDLLAATYYLLLQDRIEEAIAIFRRVNPANVATRLQYDYCAAYAAFFQEDFQTARAIAAKHANHPVDRWRKTFAAVIAQLDAAEGKADAVVDADDRNQQQSQLAATEPGFDFKVEDRQLTINYQHLPSVRVNYYVMDVELLFSRNPFVQQFRGQFSAIRPNHSVELKLPEKQASLQTPLPEALLNKNVLVEILGAGQAKTQPYYSNSLTLQVVENYGQVRVTSAKDGKPVTKAYVKVYAKMLGGEVKFYKDGYTDVRGRFDYASLSTSDLETAQRFSILVLSDDLGATVREAAPPAR